MTGALRDAVRSAVGGVLFNAMNYPERVQHLMLGQDISPLTQKVTDAVLAALSQQRPDVEAIAEALRAFDALPTRHGVGIGSCVPTAAVWALREQIAALPPQTHRTAPRSDQDGSVGTDDRAGRNGEPE